MGPKSGAFRCGQVWRNSCRTLRPSAATTVTALRKAMIDHDLLADSFTDFVRQVEPRLRHALCAAFGSDRGREATADALAFGWEHWDRIRTMENPAGYLFGCGQEPASTRAAISTHASCSAARRAAVGRAESSPGVGRSIGEVADRRDAGTWFGVDVQRGSGAAWSVEEHRSDAGAGLVAFGYESLESKISARRQEPLERGDSVFVWLAEPNE